VFAAVAGEVAVVAVDSQALSASSERGNSVSCCAVPGGYERGNADDSVASERRSSG
jgi:hypothetical protein